MSSLDKHSFVKVDTIITLNKEIIVAINDFVEHIDTKRYNQRNQTNEKKKKKDQFAGKAFEWASYLYLTKAGLQCSEPDMNIYESNKKSFAPDLNVEGVSLHCKSCYKNSKYPTSWVFQRSDSNRLSGKDKEFYNPSKVGLLMAGVFDEKSFDVEIKWMIDKNNIIGLLEEPLVWQLKGIKECLYNERLEKEYVK